MQNKNPLAELPEHGHFLIEAVISTARLFLEDVSPYWTYREKKDGVYCLVLYRNSYHNNAPFVSITHHPNFGSDVLVTYCLASYRKGSETRYKEEVKRYSLPSQQLEVSEEIANHIKKPSSFLTVISES